MMWITTKVPCSLISSGIRNCKFMKKFVLVQLCLLLTACSFTSLQSKDSFDHGSVNYPNESISGFINDETLYEYELNYDGNSYSIKKCKPTSNCNLVIPSIYRNKPVTEIDDYAFASIPYSVNKIYIPSSIQYIGKKVFHNASTSEIIVSESNNAFATYNYGLYDMSFEHLYYTFGKHESFSIHKNTRFIEKNIFIDNLSIKSFEVDSGSAYYSSENGILYNKDKTVLIRCPTEYEGGVQVNSSVKEIGDYAFYKCNKITNVVLSRNVETINNNSFTYSSITSIDLGEILSYFDFHCFDHCMNMDSITIPSSVTDIADYYNPREPINVLSEINVNSNNPKYLSVDGVLYERSGKMLVYPCKKDVTEFIFPDFVNELGAVVTGPNLSKVVLSDSLTKIDNNGYIQCSNTNKLGGLEYLGTKTNPYHYFYKINSKYVGEVLIHQDCKLFGDALSNRTGSDCKIRLDSENESFTLLNNMLLSKDKSKLIWIQFESGKEFISIPNETKEIFRKTYHNLGVFPTSSIEISLSVGSNFKDYKNLVGSEGIVSCNTNINIDNNPYFKYENGFFLIDNGQTIYKAISVPKNIEIPKGIKKIANNAFMGLDIETIIFNEGLEEIGDSAFMLCPIKNAIFSSTIKSICDNAFYGCKLEMVELKEGLAYLGRSAFSEESNILKSVYLPSTLTTVGDCIFLNITYYGYEIPSETLNVYCKLDKKEIHNRDWSYIWNCDFMSKDSYLPSEWIKVHWNI